MSASSSGGVIVFLDIDGVLLPFGSNAAAVEPPALFDDACLSALSALLAAPLPCEPRLVLSSTWRAQPAFVADILDEFRRFGAANDGSPLGAVTAFVDATSTEHFGARQHEIASWLEQRRAQGQAPAAWVCLDDEELLDGEECAERRAMFEGHVVQTRSDVGLTAEQAARAVALLRAQLAGSGSTSKRRRGDGEEEGEEYDENVTQPADTFVRGEPHCVEAPPPAPDPAEFGTG